MKQKKTFFLALVIIFILSIGIFFLVLPKNNQYEIVDGVMTFPIYFVEGLPVVSAEISGKTIPLMVDFGASEKVSINLEKYPDLEINFLESNSLSIIKDAQGNSFTVKEFNIPNLKIEELELTDTLGIEAIFDSNFAPPVDDGTLGRKFFEDYLVLLDYKNKKIFLSESNLVENLEEWNFISFPSNEKGIIANCEIYGKKYNCLFDTGSTSNFIKTEIAEEILEKDIFSQEKINLPLNLEDSKYSLETNFRNIDGLPSFFDLVLGADFFKDHPVIIDMKNQKLYFK